MVEDPLSQVSWEVPYQGKPCYSAFCENEVLIIQQDDNLQVADAVPRRKCELTEDDRKQLERLNISPSSEFDDASIMAARYALDKRFTTIRVERGEPGRELTKKKALRMIQDTMKTSLKPAIIVRYIGPGKKGSGDWCFQDGFIKFSDIVQCYQDNFKGKILGVFCDCSFGGYWVKACMEFLDEHGVRPCAHSAKEKKLLISTSACCKHLEIPYHLLFSVRGYTNDKNSGVLGRWGNGREITGGQHVKTVDTVTIECSNKSIDGPCALEPNETWRQLLNSERIYMVRGTDKGRPAWHYVLLVDDEETIRQFVELTQGANAGKHTLNVENYGQVLKSGFGEEPPNEVKEWMKENYGAS